MEEKETVQEKSEVAKYLEEIQKLKANSVSKDDYDRLKDENRDLLNSIVNGRTVTEEEQPKAKKDINELRANLRKENPSNLEYVQNVLELRKAVIDEGGTDPFLPYGQKIVPTHEDIESANRVANVLQECVDLADGDSLLFTNELYRRLIQDTEVLNTYG